MRHGRAVMMVCGVSVVSFALVGASLLGQSRPVQQVQGQPRTVSSASMAVPFVHDARTAGISVIAPKRAKCAPGRCFSVMVQAKANAAWRLESKLWGPPQGFSLAISSINAPAVPVADLNAMVWSSVLQGGAATRTQVVEVTLYGARLKGPGGRLPSELDIASLLQFRLVRQ
ncbi:hypothetical protein [Gemmatimonas phototrophica]|uniref:Uncharacterized protein n=1 Tax=Gemmatimonas phototrophica TaxID=1379270 RepID=A0A143BIK4_9BACT|nr:hypothetical protein [Gemmatimonas phototrophica]AMW04838.1 hypothetical protein GEMMAAP_08320 [Gemmatimonas phototrophica]